MPAHRPTPRHLLLARGAAVALAALAIAASAPARLARQPEDAPETTRPTTAGRVVAVFDFNERAFNPQPVPRDWFRAQHLPPERPRPGFPQYNAAKFDRSIVRTPAESPGNNASVMLPTNGGSTSLRSSSRAIPIFPGADYIVTAAVRTTELQHARGYITARLLDAEANPIPGAELRSQPVLSPTEWALTSVQVPGRFPRAAYLQLDLELLQPQHASTTRAGKHAVALQDFSGAAWFDDVAVFQLPRLELTVTGAGVLTPGEPAVFKADIRDLAGEPMAVKLTITDIDERVVWESDTTLPAGGGETSWSPPLDALGWYLATLRVSARGNLIGETTSTAVRIAPPTSARRTFASSTPTGGNWSASEPDRTLRIGASDVPQGAYLAVSSLLSRLGARSVVLAAPPDALRPLKPGEPSPLEGSEFAAAVSSLLFAGVELGVSLPRLPAALAGDLRIDAAEPRTLLSQDPKAWMPFLQPMLDMFGQRLTWWQLGDTQGDALSFAISDSKQSQRFRSLIAATVPAPQSVLTWRADLPWPSDQRWGASGADAVSLTLPWTFALDAIALAAPTWLGAPAVDGGAGRGRSELAVVIQTPPEEQFGRRAAAIELARRTVLLWQHLGLGRPDGTGPGGTQRPTIRLMLESPWRAAPSARAGISPEATIAVWANLSHRLSGRTYAGDLGTAQSSSAGAITALLFAPLSSAASPSTGGVASRPPGLIVAWANSTPVPGQPAPALRGYFAPPGQPLRVLDIFGNATIVQPDASGLLSIPLAESPVFIEDADADLSLFIAGFKVTPSLVSAINTVHDHELILTNPYPVRITGDIQLPQQQPAGPSAPAGAATPGREWRFSATAPLPFSIPPGGQQRIPFSFSFPAQEEAGPRTIQAIVRLQASRTYPPMRLSAPIEIGLEDLELQIATSRSPTVDGPDVVLLATVTNSGRASRTLRVDVVAPRQARQEQAISNLGPGETVVRRFVFPAGAAALRGTRIRATLSDVDGAERLNRSTAAP